LNGFTAFLKWECDSFETYLAIIREFITLFGEADDSLTFAYYRDALDFFLEKYQPLTGLVVQKLKRKKKAE
jgi:hypothetical protein